MLTCAPRRRSNKLIDTITRARPDLIFLLFGRRSFLPSTLFWRRSVDRPRFARMISWSTKLLFGWEAKQLDPSERTLLYGAQWEA
jgi:lysosomal acid lipase/cholesteryl ester hydrolase